MKKLLLILLLGSYLFANHCDYNYKRTYEVFSQMKQAAKLSMLKKIEQLTPTIYHYMDGALVSCPMDGYKFKDIQKMKIHLDITRRKVAALKAKNGIK